MTLLLHERNYKIISIDLLLCAILQYAHSTLNKLCIPLHPTHYLQSYVEPFHHTVTLHVQI